MEQCTNKYLHITLEDNKVHVCAWDGVFGYSALLNDWWDYEKYCDERANDWKSYPYANFDSYNKEDREKVAKKWIEAKNLREGSYEYYFNLEDLKECFHNKVAELAKCMGITDEDILEMKEIDLEKEIKDYIYTLPHSRTGIPGGWKCSWPEEEVIQIVKHFLGRYDKEG